MRTLRTRSSFLVAIVLIGSRCSKILLSHQEHQEWNKEQRKTSSWHRAFFPASVHSFLFFFPIKNSQALGGCFRNELRRYLSVASRVTSTTGRYYNLLLEEDGRRKQLATPLQKKTGIYVSHFLGIFLMKKKFLTCPSLISVQAQPRHLQFSQRSWLGLDRWKTISIGTSPRHPQLAVPSSSCPTSAPVAYKVQGWKSR